MERRRNGLLRIALGVTLACPGPAAALLNVDLHNPSDNHGTPSDVFGAAAAQPGRWNVGDVSDTLMTPQPLVDLQGFATPWTLTIDIDGTHSLNHFSTPAGDVTALLDDGHFLPTIEGSRVNFTFTGLPANTYDIYAYGWHSNLADEHSITIEIAGVQQVVQPTSFNFMDSGFAEGETHTVHPGVIVPAGGDLVITAIATQDDDFPQAQGVVNGFQIVPAPEPTAASLGLATWAALLLRARRTSRRSGLLV